MLVDINTTLGVVNLDIVLKGLKAQLVTIFEVSVVLCMFLHRIIGQVYECVIYILKVNAELC